MLYTRKCDGGNTKLFDCPQGVYVNKSARIFQALGTVDEINSFIGYTKVLSRKFGIFMYFKFKKINYEDILNEIQQILFSIQAELGGSKIFVTTEDVLYLEEIIAEIETLLPPIHSFIIPGGSEVGAMLDVCRTVVRRGEREMVLLNETKEKEISPTSVMFMNRLSSAMYAMARFANYQSGNIENAPKYK